MIIILTIFTDEEISNRGQMTRLAAEAAFYKTFSIMPITFLEGKALKTVEEVYFLSSYDDCNSQHGKTLKCMCLFIVYQ